MLVRNMHAWCSAGYVYFVRVGKVVLLKDLSNIATKLNSSKSRNDLHESEASKIYGK